MTVTTTTDAVAPGAPTTTDAAVPVDMPHARCPVEVAGDGWDGWLATKVVESDETTLVLQPPFVPADGRFRMLLPPPGTDVTVHWSAGAGLAEVRVRIDECPKRPVAVWRADVTAPPVIAQRRAHQRMPVTIDLRLNGERAMWQARSVDLSEGGVRCVTRSRVSPEPGEVLELETSAAGGVRARAVVLRTMVRPDGDTELAMQFEPLRPGELARLTGYLTDLRQRQP